MTPPPPDGPPGAGLVVQGATASVLAEAVAPEAASAARYRRGADAAETVRGYRRDWRDFAAWCAARDLAPLPAA